MEEIVESKNLVEKNLSKKNKLILIVDDCLDLLNLNKIILEMEGYEVFTAQSGKEALAVLDKIAPPNLILLDMQMADLSGPDFLIKFEETRSELFKIVPVVFLSAQDKVPESKAVGFVRKPIDVDDFLEAVQHFTRKAK